MTIPVQLNPTAPMKPVVKPTPVHIGPLPVRPVPVSKRSSLIRTPRLAMDAISVGAQTVSYRPGLDYGVGVDTPSGNAANVAVTGSPSTIPLAAGETLNYTMTQVSTEEDLQTALGISASASGGVGLFSASARMDYAKSCAVNSSSVFAMVSIQVTEAFQMIKAPGIDPAAASVLANGNESRFRQQYGDMFVRGLQTGGVFFGMIEIETKDETDKQSLSIAVSGSYAAFSASGQFSQSFTDAVKNRGVKVTCHIEGGTLPNPLPTNVDTLMQAAGQWAPSVAQKAVPYSALLDSYSILPLPNPPNFVDLQHQMDVLTQCALWRDQDNQALRDMAYVKSYPEQFTGVDMAQLEQWQNEVSADLNTIAAAASNAVNNPVSAALPQLKLPPPVSLPARVQSILVTVPDWGSGESLALDAYDGSGKLVTQSADHLGLKVNVTIAPNNNPNVEGDVASLSPPAGSQVPRGTTITAVVWGRAPND
ncbi:MAG: PASTA domain-containing protein [Caulobacteraceae bacterium]|nr:PASTA domain-containing protein [Caulobacteraceae bacterium]